MKPFDYNKYLKNNRLLKESIDTLQPTYSYFVRVVYNDYPSIGERTEAGAMMSFTNLVNKLGGTAKLAQNKEQEFGYKCFEVSGVDYDQLSMMWKKTHSNNRWIIEKEESMKESFMGPDTDVYEEAQNILDDILSERDWMEIADMTFEDALDTVEAYGHTGQKAEDIANKLIALAQNS